MTFFIVILILIGVAVGIYLIYILVKAISENAKKSVKKSAATSSAKTSYLYETRSCKVAALKELNTLMGFDRIEYSKMFYQAVSQKRYLYNNLKSYEIDSFLREQRKLKNRINYLYEHYYKQAVEEIRQKCHTPVELIKAANIPFHVFIKEEERIFNSLIVKYTNTPSVAYLHSSYTTPAGRNHYSVDMSFKDENYAIPEDQYSFGYVINSKYIHEEEYDYESMSNSTNFTRVFECNGLYYQGKKGLKCKCVSFGKSKTICVESIVYERSYKYQCDEIDFTKAPRKEILKTIYMSRSCESISIECFKNFSSLEEIFLSNKITSIPSMCFMNCTNLYMVKLPNQLQSIENKAFSGCLNLKELYLPKSIKSIAEDAFIGCKNILLISEQKICNPSLKLKYSDDTYFYYVLKSSK